ncbi:MAG: YggS family pyridoxal phosphate-dependent enzyme [Tepidiformaceae bacterium]
MSVPFGANAPAGLHEMAGRIAAVRECIEAACERAHRDPAGVTLVAVSKTFPPEAVAAAAAAGIADFGENRVQEGVAKIARLSEQGIAPTWHLIGHLQTNKVRAAMSAFAILQAVDSERLLTAIANAATSPTRVMLEVNAGGEASKFGVAPAGLPSLLAFARSLPGISVEGLMTVAPASSDAGEVRHVFRALRELAEANSLQSLSMGMSNDFEIAIEEGATHVRIGRAIFGERP